MLREKDKLPLSPSKGMSVRMDKRPENIAERFSVVYIYSTVLTSYVDQLPA